MAVTKIVDPGGTGDYLSLAALCADTAGISGGDLVTAGETLTIWCICTNGNPDPGGADFNVFTTSSSYYITIYVIEAYRPPHRWATGNYYRIDYTGTGDGSAALYLYTDYMYLDGLCVRFGGAYDTVGMRVASVGASNWIQIEQCVICSSMSEASTDHARGIYVYDSSAVVKIKNTMIYDCKTVSDQSCGIYASSASKVVCYNVTAANCKFGFASNSGYLLAKNCGAQDCNDGWWGTFHANSDYNASDISSDAPGANSRNGTSGTVTFKNAAGDDYALAEGDTNWRGKGTDLSSDGEINVIYDIDGTKRSAYDIGAYEFLAASGALSVPVPTMDGTAEAGTFEYASGTLTVPVPTMAGTVTTDYDASGDILVPLPIFSGAVTVTAPETEPITVGYETFPLQPGFLFREGYTWQTLQTPPEAGAVKTRSMDDRPVRQWRLVWTKASRTLTPADAELLRSFARDHLATPFYLDLPDPISRPYSEPTLGTLAESTLEARTVYVGYSWAGDTGETQISIETATLAMDAGSLLTVTVPHFPVNVTKAYVYVGPTADLMYKQPLPITQSGGTWTEPAAGYDDGGAAPPSSNTLTETVLAKFQRGAYSIKQYSGVGYEAEVYLVEHFSTVTREFYATGDLSVPVPTFDGTATVPAQMVSGALTVPVPTLDGTATYQSTPPAQTAVEGALSVPVAYVSGVCTLAPAGDYFVAKSGSDSNPGTSASPFLTITHALDVATPGKVIVIQAGTYSERISNLKPSITLRGVGYPVIYGNGTQSTIYSSGVSDGCTFERLCITHGTNGFSSREEDDWFIDRCKIYDVEQMGVSFVYGNRHRIVNCEIHDVGNHDEAMGVKLDRCQSCLVDSNAFWLVRKEAARDIRGGPNTIVRNHMQACGTGIAYNYDVHDSLVRDNYIYHCYAGGMDAKHTILGTGYSRMIYNTLIDCGWGGVRIGSNVPAANWVQVKRNITKNHRGHCLFFADGEATGGNVIVDENLYWEIAPGPDCFARIDDWGSTPTNYKLDTLAQLRSLTGWEANGVMYSAAIVDQYGASGYTTSPVVYLPYDLEVEDASSNSSTAYRTCDWDIYTTWSGTSSTNEWIVYDLGSTKSMDVFRAGAWGENDSRAPRDILVQTSDSPTSGWVTRVNTSMLVGQSSLNIWHIDAPVSARYVRFYMTNTFGGSPVRFSEFAVGLIT